MPSESPPLIVIHRMIAIRAALLDVIGGAVMAVFALGVWIGANYIENANTGLKGPGSFPRGVALIFGAVSLLMAARGAKSLRDDIDHENVIIARPLPVLATMLLVIVYPMLLGYFGYYSATGPWLILLLYACGYRKLLPMFAITVGFLAFTKLVFEMSMGIPLP